MLAYRCGELGSDQGLPTKWDRPGVVCWSHAGRCAARRGTDRYDSNAFIFSWLIALTN